jgi:hypothetical protein
MECDKTTYGYPGKKQTHCHGSIHKSDSLRRCNYSLTCTHLATHGRDGQLQERGLHAETDMINLEDSQVMRSGGINWRQWPLWDPRSQGVRVRHAALILPCPDSSLNAHGARVNGGRRSMCQAATGLPVRSLTNTWSSRCDEYYHRDREAICEKNGW